MAIGFLQEQLFVDDFLVESSVGITRTYNHPTKAFDTPVLCSETDLERVIDPGRPDRFAPVAERTPYSADLKIGRHRNGMHFNESGGYLAARGSAYRGLRDL